MKIEVRHLSGLPEVEGELHRTFDEVLNKFINSHKIHRSDIISVVADSIYDGQISYYTEDA